MRIIKLLEFQFTNNNEESSHMLIQESQKEQIKAWLEDHACPICFGEWVYEPTWHIITVSGNDVHVSKGCESLCKPMIERWKEIV